jgi:lysozyme family protein
MLFARSRRVSLTLPQLIAENEARWQKCQITPDRMNEVQAVAKRLVVGVAKGVYSQIGELTSVPWWVVAVIHEREADQNWSRSIAQGDPWNAPSRHVPKGRGPFHSFVDAAVDALKNCAPKAADWKDWSAGGTLTILEEYNGLGYEDYHAEASPYIWGATNQEQRGKYIGDGEYSQWTWDRQIGCAALLIAMMQLDKSITFKGAAAAAPQGIIQRAADWLEKKL